MSFFQNLNRNSDDEQDNEINECTNSNFAFERSSNQNFFDGLEEIVKFKVKAKNNFEYRYLCTLCSKEISKATPEVHCSTLVHLFRYMQSKYPVELKRIYDVDGSNLSEHITYVVGFLKRINENISPKPKCTEIDHIQSEKEFERRKTEIFDARPVIRLNNLIALQERDYRNEAIQHENLLQNIKRSRSPPSLFIQQKIKEDIDMEDDNEIPSHRNQGSFNSNFNYDKHNVANICNQPENQPETSDIDTDSLENEPNRIEFTKKIKKKLSKSIKKKRFSQKFFDILILSYNDPDFNDLDDTAIEEIMQIATDQTEKT